jgi:hypothetical protein
VRPHKTTPNLRPNKSALTTLDLAQKIMAKPNIAAEIAKLAFLRM